MIIIKYDIGNAIYVEKPAAGSSLCKNGKSSNKSPKIRRFFPVRNLSKEKEIEDDMGDKMSVAAAQAKIVYNKTLEDRSRYNI